MIIPTSTLQSAIRRVFKHTDAVPGVPVQFSALTQEWARLGMRACDLRDVMRELVDQGYAETLQRSGTLAFELTPVGYDRLYSCEEKTH